MTTTSVAQSMSPVVGKIGQGSSQLTISFWAKKRVNAASAGLVGGDFGAQTAGAELFLTRDNTDSDGTNPADSMQFHLND